MEDLAPVDPESQFLASKQQSSNEWELYKENVMPLKRGRNVNLLNDALKAQNDNISKKSLLENRRKLIEAIDEYKGEDPLQPWLECVKWVQESFPSGGEFSGLIVIYEQCVRTFWNDKRYKDDLRYLKVWLEYAESCADAEVIYSFLDANQIGQTHSIYYMSYALHMESKNKMRKADEIFNLGIARKAQPIEKLESAYKKFFARSMQKNRAKEEEPADDHIPVRSFGTSLIVGEARNQNPEQPIVAQKKARIQRINSNAPFSIYSDTVPGFHSRSTSSSMHQAHAVKSEENSWHTLGTRAERNKENDAIPAKWTAHKIPQRGCIRTGAAIAIPPMEVFVDDECAELPSRSTTARSAKPSMLQLRRGNNQNLKKDAELLKENPLRHFPPSSLLR